MSGRSGPERRFCFWEIMIRRRIDVYKRQILYRLSKIGKKYALEMKDVFDEVNGNIIDE